MIDMTERALRALPLTNQTEEHISSLRAMLRGSGFLIWY